MFLVKTDMCVTAVSEEMHEIALIVCLTLIFLISFLARFAFFVRMVLSNMSRYSLRPSTLKPAICGEIWCKNAKSGNIEK